MPGISINIIRVGWEQFTEADETTIGDAISFLRNTYATVGLTLRRAEHFVISNNDVDGRDIIDNEGEAGTLTDLWTVPNNAVDVFVVKLYVGSVAGLSPVGGPCDKDAKGMDGVVVELFGEYTGLILAHEVGHYLGLSHVTGDTSNLMYSPAPNGGMLTSGQGTIMKSHCFVEA